jgi:S-adenosyl methyltransferase
VVTESDWQKTFRPDIPSSARIYDYFLGGRNHFPADREAAEEIIRAVPGAYEAMKLNRAFVGRVVRYLVREAGVTQLLDIGAGLPTQGNVHEIALEEDPRARTVYVDHDPVVLAHARDLLSAEFRAVTIQYDMREPDAILADPELRAMLDFGQPVAVLINSMLHFIPDKDDPAGIMARLLAPFPAGSYLTLTHATADESPEVNQAAKVFDEATTRMFVRTYAEVMNLIRGLELVEPGLVWTPLWRPGPGDVLPEDPREAHYYALVARKTS